MTGSDKASICAWLKDEIGCDDLALQRLERFVCMLAEESTQQNLVARGSFKDVWNRHIADSAQLLLHVPRETPTGPWLDLGSGAGFPGLVVAVCRPDIEMILVESRTLRAEWLRFVKSELALANVATLHQRLEVTQTRSMSVISARAFAPLPKLIALASRFSTPETLWLLPKGRSARKELADMTNSVQAMFHVKQSVTDKDAALLVGRGRPSLTARRT